VHDNQGILAFGIERNPDSILSQHVINPNVSSMMSNSTRLSGSNTPRRWFDDDQYTVARDVSIYTEKYKTLG